MYRDDIAEAILDLHHNVTAVLEKESGRQGEYRLRELSLIKGDPDTVVVHKEAGCRFKLDPREAYFSTRESTERERINSKISPGEDILVMFSGVGPYPVCIARKHPDVTVTAIELNPRAHEFCVENVRLNKLEGRVTPIHGDVVTVTPSLGRAFDRVMMPLPKGAHLFLDVAVPAVKSGGVLHFYHWAPEEDLWTEAEELLREAAERHGRSVEFINHQKVSLYSPRNYKIRVDALFGA